jgi:hypothetical protein
VTKITYSNFSQNGERLLNTLSSPVPIILLPSSSLFSHIQCCALTLFQLHTFAIRCFCCRLATRDSIPLYITTHTWHHVCSLGPSPHHTHPFFFLLFFFYFFFFFYFVCGSHLRRDPPNTSIIYDIWLSYDILVFLVLLVFLLWVRIKHSTFISLDFLTLHRKARWLSHINIHYD